MNSQRPHLRFQSARLWLNERNRLGLLLSSVWETLGMLLFGSCPSFICCCWQWWLTANFIQVLCLPGLFGFKPFVLGWSSWGAGGGGLGSLQRGFLLVIPWMGGLFLFPPIWRWVGGEVVGDRFSHVAALISAYIEPRKTLLIFLTISRLINHWWKQNTTIRLCLMKCFFFSLRGLFIKDWKVNNLSSKRVPPSPCSPWHFYVGIKVWYVQQSSAKCNQKHGTKKALSG